MSNLAPGRFGYSTLTFITARSLLAALEARLALFVERGDALAAVLGRDHAVIGLDLEHHAAREIHLQPVMDRMLGLTHRNRRVIGDAARRLHCLLEQPIWREQTVDHAPFIRLLRRKRTAGQDDLLGAPLADRARQVLGAAGPGHDAEGYFGQRKARGLGRVKEIAAQRQFAAAGISGAVDRADDRHRTAGKGADRAFEQEMLRLPCLVGHAEALLEVAAGAECLVAGPGQEDAAIGERVAIDRIEEIQEVASHLRVHRIGDLRPVQDQQDETVALVLDLERLVAAVHSDAPARQLGHHTPTRCELRCFGDLPPRRFFRHVLAPDFAEKYGRVLPRLNRWRRIILAGGLALPTQAVWLALYNPL